jgi:TonB family protein
MRFYARTIFGLLSLAAATVSLPASAAADPTPTAAPTEPLPSGCPGTQVLATRDGKAYVATFGRNTPWAGTISISFYTATDAYSVQLPISATKQVGASDYRSEPITILNPAADKLDDAEIDFGGTDDAGPCIDYFHLPDDLSTDPDVKKAFADVDPAQPPVSPVKVVGESAALTCKHPYKSAAVAGDPAQLFYPQSAQLSGATGRVLVKIKLTPTASVAEASIVRSSGNDYLDASALSTATKTHYSPEIFRCKPVVSYYLFAANFEP